MKKQSTTESRIAFHEKKLVELKDKLELESQSELIKIPELKIEVEAKLHLDMNKISQIKIPNGWRLLTLSEWLFIYNNYRDKLDYGNGNYIADEIVKQPIKENEGRYPYWNVWLHGLGGYIRSGLDGSNWGLGYDDDGVRGVRFCRDLK